MQVHINNKKILFKGFNTQPFSRYSSRLSQREFNGACSYIGNLLNETPSRIQAVALNVDPSRMSLLKQLARNYRMRNSELPLNKREEKEDLFQIFKSITKPMPEHFDILRRFQGGFDSIKNIFSSAKDEKSLEFVSELQRNVLRDVPNQSNLIVGILSSKYKTMFMENIAQFKSYFKLNSKKENVMKDLEAGIEKQCFDGKKYDAELAVNRLMQFKTVRDYVEPLKSSLTNNYTPERGRFLWSLVNDFLYRKTDTKVIKKDDILDLFKSTNTENIKLRLAVLDNFKYNAQKFDNNELKELKKLLNKIEKDKEVKNFVQNTVEQGLAVNSVSELNSVIKSTDVKKANYFFDNVRRIVALSEGKERQNALKTELENPFFLPKQERKTKIWKVRDNVKDYGFFSKLPIFIKNKIKGFIYNNYKSKTEMPVAETTSKINIVKPMNATKVKLASEVNEIIKKKLGKRTYNDFEDNFRLKVTKIRLALLPDMFESVKATRTQARKQGIEPATSNRDVSRLYELINGRTKKLVKYMLKKCDENGNRIYDVRQIIGTIEKANTEIKNLKNLNPNYRAEDANMYYSRLYNSIVEKHGQLRSKSTK